MTLMNDINKVKNTQQNSDLDSIFSFLREVISWRINNLNFNQGD